MLSFCGLFKLSVQNKLYQKPNSAWHKKGNGVENKAFKKLY